MSNTDLFAQAYSPKRPLAARMRAETLDEYIGQKHILGDGKALRLAIEHEQLHSFILWGPPGVGKTTLAHIVAQSVNAEFVAMSAIMSGVKDIRAAVEKARDLQQMNGRQTILFVDEVHRFNKSQQDAFLPFVEDGTITFIGATTENPSFEVNNALLSRCRVYVLKSLAHADLEQLLVSALTNEVRGLGARGLTIKAEERDLLIKTADGDARRLLNILEIVSDLVEDRSIIEYKDIAQVLGSDIRRFDKGGDVFYEQISALHKSVRGSDPDAALYWMARMFDGGCDPIYVARRVVRMASEEIGNADPRALQLSLNAWEVQERLGSPEGELAIAQAVVYLACAPKSNAVYNAYNAVRAEIKKQPGYDVPMHLRNAPSGLMKDLGYGDNYRYAHNEPDAFVAGEQYLPDELDGRVYYHPVERGLEIKIASKLSSLRAQNEQARNEKARNEKSRKEK
ncbi:MAG: putative ATPase [Flavobacteriales bacterium]|jgi:putative ATPase